MAQAEEVDNGKTGVKELNSNVHKRHSMNSAIETMARLKLDDDQDLRATCAKDPLSWGGALLRPPLFGDTAVQGHASIEVAERVYRLSFPVKVINAFWSHSWRAPYWQKIMVLMIYYNGLPAAIIGSLAAAVAAGLAAAEILPAMVHSTSAVQADKDKVYGFFVWSTVFGLIAYLLTLVLWRSRRTVFLDKVCIHQTDDVLRRKGIESIGAYLTHCQTMLVLWDATYVTRLWCVFELAAFLYAHQNEPNINVFCRPVIIGPTALVTLIAVSVEVMGILLLPAGVILIFVGGSSFMLLVILVRTLRSYHHSLQQLREDFRCFSLDRAGCFCCNEVHHNLGGCSILCDRELVESCINLWFGSSDKFNAVVQERLFSVFQKQLGTVAFPYRTMLLVLIPAAWAFLDLANTYFVAEAYDLAASQFLIGIFLWVAALPTVFALTSTVASKPCIQRNRGMVLNWIIAICGGALSTVAVFILSGSGLLLIAVFDPLMGTIVYVVVVGAAALISFYCLGRFAQQADDTAYGELRVTKAGTVTFSGVRAAAVAAAELQVQTQLQGVATTSELHFDEFGPTSTESIKNMKTIQLEWC